MDTNIKQNVLILPGMSDEIQPIRLATAWWSKHGFKPNVFRIGWRDGNSNFEVKLRRIEKFAEQLAKDGPIPVVGTSAGGSASLNLLFERSDIIKNVVSICGRLRVGETKKRIPARTFVNSEQYRQSVVLIESREAEFSDELRKRVMTISAKYGDEYVPLDTSTFNGANNLFLPTAEHIFSIASALTFFAKPIFEFIAVA